MVRPKPTLDLPAEPVPIREYAATSDHAGNVGRGEATVQSVRPEPAAVAAPPAPAARSSSTVSKPGPTERRVVDSNPRASTPEAESKPPADARGKDATAREEIQQGTQQGEYSLKVNVDSILLNVSVLDRGTNRSL